MQRGKSLRRTAFCLQSEENALGQTSKPANPTKLGAEIDVFEHTIKGTATSPTYKTSHAVQWNGVAGSGSGRRGAARPTTARLSRR